MSMEGVRMKLNEQDRRAVETMVHMGLDLETLWAIFPKFDEEALRMVYESVKGNIEAYIGITEPICNCS